ncbi:MAG: DNA polymerase III subunit epsilon [Pseudohongiellaceae bacterium]|nr:DNA polymerase III subunit epsilon [Pseudohongiellaceae bacterium]
MRQIVLDTETTGLDPAQGHRVIEIGGVEIENRRLTGRHYHVYLNPDREIDEEAEQVHGISSAFLADKPRFHQILDEFMEFVKGSELVIHNAPFDVGFLNHELKLAGKADTVLENSCLITDTLVMARKKHPGQRNSLDALCKRYEVDNSQRELHGALLDAEILADVYLAMTGGQTFLQLSEEQESDDDNNIKFRKLQLAPGSLKVISASEAELSAHKDFLAQINAKSGDSLVWSEKDSSEA